MLRTVKPGGRRHRRWTAARAAARAAAVGIVSAVCAVAAANAPALAAGTASASGAQPGAQNEAQSDVQSDAQYDARPGAQAGREPLPLERLFDSRAVSDDARPGAADFDGAGNSLSAQDLAAAGWTPGRELAFDGARLHWPRPAPGKPDNVRAAGQAVRLGGRGEALTFLVAGTTKGAGGGDAGGTGTVRYRDGSRSTYRLTAPDWRRGPLTTKAVGLPHLNTGSGRRSETTRLYAVSVPVAPGRELDSVVLPQDPGPDRDLHVFSLALRGGSRGWTGTWAASTSGYAAVGPWKDRTLRLVVHSSAGGPATRIRLENTFAPRPVRIGHATVALQGRGAAAAGKPRALSFGGQPGTVIPAGAQAFSDSLGFRVPEGTNLLVSIHLPGTVTAVPLHSYTSQVSYLTGDGSGDRTDERGAGAYTGKLETWPLLTGVDVADGPGSVVTLGDSITDGERSTPGANGRWPDLLARRLQAQHSLPRFGILNHGISGNRVVTDRYPGDGTSTIMSGVSAQHRLERDVLAQTSARTVIVFEGVNDIRSGTSAAQVITGLKAIAARAHERGLRVIAATIAPCGGFYDCTADAEAQRTAINRHIRADDGTYDAVFDFDEAVRDPRQPDRMLPAYDGGDHLHPNDAGMKAFSDAIDLRELV